MLLVTYYRIRRRDKLFLCTVDLCSPNLHQRFHVINKTCSYSGHHITSREKRMKLQLMMTVLSVLFFLLFQSGMLLLVCYYFLLLRTTRSRKCWWEPKFSFLKSPKGFFGRLRCCRAMLLYFNFLIAVLCANNQPWELCATARYKFQIIVFWLLLRNNYPNYRRCHFFIFLFLR